MILGVDHIALSCGEIAAGVESLTTRGYAAAFIQEDVYNHPEKRPFLKSYTDRHSVAYCRFAGGVSVELTQHSRPLQKAPSPYQVLLNPPAVPAAPWNDGLPAAWPAVWRSVFPGSKPQAAEWDPFHAQCWQDAGEGSNGSSVRAVLVPATDMQASEQFWVNGLGCEAAGRGTTDTGHAWVRITFRSPVPAWHLDVVLAETDQRAPDSYLDDTGFPCLALLTSQAANDRAQALDMGATAVTKPFPVHMAGKELTVVLLRGPGREIIELIELQKEKK